MSSGGRRQGQSQEGYRSEKRQTDKHQESRIRFAWDCKNDAWKRLSGREAGREGSPDHLSTRGGKGCPSVQRI